MADNSFKIVARLDVPKSAEEIANDDIPELEKKLIKKENGKVNIIAGLNITESEKVIQSQIDKFFNKDKTPTIKVGLEIEKSNSLKQIENTGISDKMFKQLLKNMDISKDKTDEYKSELRDLANELKTAWNTGNQEKYKNTLNSVIDLIGKGQREIKKYSKDSAGFLELQERLAFFKDGVLANTNSKFYIDDSFRTELEHLVGSEKEVKSLLNSLYGIGNWSYQSKSQLNGFENLRNQIDGCSEAYARFEQTSQGGNNQAEFIVESAKAIKLLKETLNAKETLNGSLTEQLGAEDAHKYLEEIISDILQLKTQTNTNDVLGDIGENTSEIQKETKAIEQEVKAVERLKAIRETTVYDNIGNQTSRTSVYGDTGFTKTSIFDENDELVSYAITENYQQLEKAIDKAEAKSIKLRQHLMSIYKSAERGSKPIQDESHWEKLAEQVKIATVAIDKIRHVDSKNATSIEATANAEIAKLQDLVHQYQNAEYAAESLRTKDVNTVKNIQTQELDKFINKINGSKVPLDNMTSDVNELRIALANVGDKNSLTDFLNQFDTAKAKFESLKTLYQSIGGYDKQLDNLTKSWKKQGIYAGNLKTTIEGLKSSLANVKTTDGLTSWIGDFNSQIGAISQLPVKIAEYRNQLSTVKTEWDKQHTNVQSIYNAFGKLGSRLGSIKTEAGFDKWVKDFENLVLQSNRLKTNLDSQVTTQNKIYEIQSQIAKLNPNKNADEIAHLKSKLQIEEKELANLQFQANVYSKIVSFEEQERYVTEQTVKARERLETATVKSSDKATQQRIADMKEYQKQIENAISSLDGLYNKNTFTKNKNNPQVSQVKAEIDSIRTEYQKLYAELQANPTSQGLETVKTKLAELDKRFKTATASADAFEKQLKSDNSADKLARRIELLNNQIKAYASANPKAVKQYKSQFEDMYSLLKSKPDVSGLDKIAKQFQNIKLEAKEAGITGKTMFQSIGDSIKKFSSWMSMTGFISQFVGEIRNAIIELKDIDTILTEISKTSDLTTESLKKLGRTAFDSASNYGKKASDYLIGVQEMYRAGFDNAAEMSELSILAQAAGDLQSDSANNYLIATNAAYDLKGNIESLNKVLDSQNFITNNAAVSMQDMADATSEAASIASEYGVQIDELSALIAVAVSKTRESGSEVGTALKALFVNLQDTTSKPIRDAFDAVGISMTEMVNGTEKLKTPIQLIKELSEAFNSLDEGDIRRANILNDIGGKHHANTLSSILTDLKSYYQMLDYYSQGENSAFTEAMKTADSWEGKLNKLNNTITDLVNGVVNSDTAKTVIDTLTTIIDGVDSLIDEFGLLQTLIPAVFAGLSFKNVGGLYLNTPPYAPLQLCA